MPVLRITKTGFSEVYKPPNGDPRVHIILIHGLQGHPYRTWASGPAKHGDEDLEATPSRKKRGLSGFFHKAFTSRSEAKGKQPLRPGSTLDEEHEQESNPQDQSGQGRLDGQQIDSPDHTNASGNETGKRTIKIAIDDEKPFSKDQIFWPLDLLPEKCPQSRISVYGYDTLLTGYARVNKDTLYQIAMNFFHELPLHRGGNLPIIFIAHSLGGLVLKEALIMSSESHDADLKDIVKTTSAVVFMGTSHKGSKQWAAKGSKAQTIAGTLFMDNNPALFTAIWEEYKFTVKTYIEDRSLLGKEKIVPDESSLLGNLKEQAMSLTGNHSRICKFNGITDANWLRVGPQLEKYYSRAAAPTEPDEPPPSVDPALQGFREALANVDLGDTEYGIPLPMEGTCEWIHRTQQFTDWLNDSEKSRVLCVRGSLGSGKSTLMRYVVNFLRCSPLPNERTIAAFYTSSSEDGPSLKPPSEIYRSLLVQILQKPCFMVAASKIVGTHKAKLLLDKKAEAPQQELCSMLKDVFRNTSCEKTYIFLDAVDKCSDPDELIQFFQDMVAIAPGGMFKLCFTTQQSFPVIQSQCDQICLEDFNHEDIALFVDRRLLVGSTLSQESHSYLKQLILEKASGIFLWVIVVINHLRRLLIEGMDVPYLCATLDETPERLTDLYGKILTSSVRRKSPTEIRTALRVLQWVLLSARPLSLDEWHHVFAFIENMDLRSIKEWRKSKTYRENSFLLLQRVQSVCFGLVDVKDRQLPFRPLRNDSEASSLGVGAGSFESHQSIDVIHGSIRNFFLKGDGFLILDPDKECPIDYGHGYIRDVCIRYSCLEEMETAFQMNSTDGRKRAQRMGAVARSCKEAFSPPPTSYKYTTMPRGVAKKSTLEEDDDALETLSLGSSAGTSIRSVPPEKLSVSESFLGNSGSVSNLKLATNEEIPVKRIVSDYLESLDFDAQPSTPNTRTGIESVIHAEIAASCFQPLRIVEEPPCLWQYCRDMLVYHAVRADKAPTSPDKILEFLLSSKTRFNTWRMAREDMQYGATIEYFAAQWNLVTWLRFLKSQKSNLNSYGGLLSYPIIIAARKDNVEAFQYLSASFLGGARDLRFYSDSDRRSVLHHAALRPNSKVLSYMFKAFREFTIRPLINCADSKGCTPLHLAASYATNAEVRKLVRMGSDVNIANQNGNTPLHLACLRENPDVEICATLVEAGCNCELQNIDGKTAEQVVRGHEESTLTSYLMHESCYEENELCEYFANYFE